MEDDSNFFAGEDFQGEADRPVYVPRFIRVLLGVVVLLGAPLFIGLGGYILFGPERSALLSPAEAHLSALLTILLGLGMGYIGVRLLGMREHADHLVSSRGARFASYVIAALSLLLSVAFVLYSDLEYAAAAVFGAFMAYWLNWVADRISMRGQA